MQIQATDKAQTILTFWGVIANEDGTFARNGVTVTPLKIQPEFAIAESEELVLDEQGEGKLYVGYRKGIVETFFEMTLQKNEKGEEVLYFYIP